MAPNDKTTFEFEHDGTKHQFALSTRGRDLLAQLMAEVRAVTGEEKKMLCCGNHTRIDLNEDADLAYAIDYAIYQKTDPVQIYFKEESGSESILCVAMSLMQSIDEAEGLAQTIERLIAAAKNHGDEWYSRDQYFDEIIEKLETALTEACESANKEKKKAFTDGVAKILYMNTYAEFKPMFGRPDGRELISRAKALLRRLVDNEMSERVEKNTEEAIVEKKEEMRSKAGKKKTPKFNDAATPVVTFHPDLMVQKHAPLGVAPVMGPAKNLAPDTSPVFHPDLLPIVPDSFIVRAKKLRAVAEQAATPARSIERMLRAAHATPEIEDKQRMLEAVHEKLRTMFAEVMDREKYASERKERSEEEKEKAKIQFTDALSTLFSLERELPSLFGHAVADVEHNSFHYENDEEDCLIKSAKNMLDEMIEKEDAEEKEPLKNVPIKNAVICL